MGGSIRGNTLTQCPLGPALNSAFRDFVPELSGVEPFGGGSLELSKNLRRISAREDFALDATKAPTRGRPHLRHMPHLLHRPPEYARFIGLSQRPRIPRGKLSRLIRR